MNIWILQTGEPIHCDENVPRPMRAMNLSNKLVERGHDVVIWTSSFDHRNKIHRYSEYREINYTQKLSIRFIPSLGYIKHVSIRRLVDHLVLAWNLYKQLKKETSLPDIVFIGYPPIETAFIMGKFLKKKNIPFLIDVKDLWPDIFLDVLDKRLKKIAKFILFPYFLLSKKTLSLATGISTVSDSYLSWCLKFVERIQNQFDKISPLTSPGDSYDEDQLEDAKKFFFDLGIKDDKPILFFAGTFSRGFEFAPIISAASKLVNCQFVLCGDGPVLKETIQRCENLKNVFFPGWIDPIKIKSLSTISIATIAPYKNIENFRFNIPNKIIDSLKLALPILTPLDGEVRTLIELNKIGMVYQSDNDLVKSILKLVKNSKLKEKYAANAYALYNKSYNYDHIYKSLVEHLEEIPNY